MIIDTLKRAEALSTQDPGEGTSAKYWQHKRRSEDRRLAEEDRNRQRDEIQRCHAEKQTEYSRKKELIEQRTKKNIKNLIDSQKREEASATQDPGEGTSAMGVNISHGREHQLWMSKEEI